MITETVRFKNPKDNIADSNPEKLGKLKFERALSLQKHPVKGPDGDDMISICSKYIKLQTTPLVSENMYATILKSALYELYFLSNSLRTSPSDILALKIILGANEDDTTHFFYQPVCLNLKEEIFDAELQKQGIYNIVNEGEIHNYSEPEFRPSDPTNHVALYKKSVKIKHDYNDPFTGFIKDTDVTSVIFSFQEIFAFIYDITPEKPVFYIYNCARKIHTDEETYDVKHSLLLGSEIRVRADEPALEKKKVSELKDFRAAYANLAHLCPPNCARFLYPLEK